MRGRRQIPGSAALWIAATQHRRAIGRGPQSPASLRRDKVNRAIPLRTATPTHPRALQDFLLRAPAWRAAAVRYARREPILVWAVLPWLAWMGLTALYSTDPPMVVDSEHPSSRACSSQTLPVRLFTHAAWVEMGLHFTRRRPNVL